MRNMPLLNLQNPQLIDWKIIPVGNLSAMLAIFIFRFSYYNPSLDKFNGPLGKQKISYVKCT